MVISTDSGNAKDPQRSSLERTAPKQQKRPTSQHGSSPTSSRAPALLSSSKAKSVPIAKASKPTVASYDPQPSPTSSVISIKSSTPHNVRTRGESLADDDTAARLTATASGSTSLAGQREQLSTHDDDSGLRIPPNTSFETSRKSSGFLIPSEQSADANQSHEESADDFASTLDGGGSSEVSQDPHSLASMTSLQTTDSVQMPQVTRSVVHQGDAMQALRLLSGPSESLSRSSSLKSKGATPQLSPEQVSLQGESSSRSSLQATPTKSGRASSPSARPHEAEEEEEPVSTLDPPKWTMPMTKAPKEPKSERSTSGDKSQQRQEPVAASLIDSNVNDRSSGQGDVQESRPRYQPPSQDINEDHDAKRNKLTSIERQIKEDSARVKAFTEGSQLAVHSRPKRFNVELGVEFQVTSSSIASLIPLRTYLPTQPFNRSIIDGFRRDVALGPVWSPAVDSAIGQVLSLVLAIWIWALRTVT